MAESDDDGVFDALIACSSLQIAFSASSLLNVYDAVITRSKKSKRKHPVIS